MELDPVEAGLAGAQGGVGEQIRQDGGEFGDLGQASVRDPLAVTLVQGLKLA